MEQTAKTLQSQLDRYQAEVAEWKDRHSLVEQKLAVFNPTKCAELIILQAALAADARRESSATDLQQALQALQSENDSMRKATAEVTAQIERERAEHAEVFSLVRQLNNTMQHVERLHWNFTELKSSIALLKSL